MPKKSFWAAFGYAAQGIVYALRTQRNMKIHAVAAVVVISAAALLHLSWLRWVALLFAIALVMAMELVNTALESVVDLASPKIHPLAKAAKDTAAGAVLLAAVFAAAIGIIVFFDPLLELFGGGSQP
ncbi:MULTISPECIES: diacylglycerol kinase family protein [Paenibacillus]|uniref:Diacylglycerol kinase n=1 Tax=Paenibacillus albilobatus TaxID=2716884 RepID=A0A919XL25_9BACL|nr:MULTISPECIES: diacylglycerol kinase family protein [Paenibacillus]MDR9853049.1 diacylglycerol kinase family protein [Paenibacillus sp. VCA1]GIO34171.1 diacylglycerol kinase [Paenibacillus albilobatus]